VGRVEKMTELIPIFPSYIFKHKISNSLDLKQHFLPLINELRQNEKIDLKPPSGWVCSNLTTSFVNESVNNELFSSSNLLGECYRECFSNIAEDKNRSYEVTHTWFNYYTKDDYQEWHNHIGNGSDLSFVYFLSFDPVYHSPLVFKDPLHIVRKMSLDTQISGYSPVWSPDLNEGDMIMFPSYLEHCVKINNQTVDYSTPRVTISGNVKVNFYEN
jgi:hypothetical protein